MSTVFGCLCRRRVLLRFVGALSPEKHARHDFASRFWMCRSAWSVSWLRSPPPSARAPRRCLGGWYAYGWRVADVCSALRDGCPANVSGVWLTKASIAHRWREGALRTVCRMRMPRLSALVGVGVLEGYALQCHGIWFNSHLIPFSEVGGTAHTVRLVGSSSACHCARRWETSAGLWWHMLHCLSHAGSGVYKSFQIRVACRA